MSEHRSTRDIQAELEETRARIETRARALRARLDPAEIAASVVDALRTSNARQFVDNLGRSVRDNPLPVVLTGIGIAWLAGSSGRGEQAGDEEDDGHPLRDRLSSAAHETADGLRSGAREVRRRARVARRRAGQRGAAFKERVSEGAEHVQDGWDRVVEEQPLLVGLVGLALGAAAGALLPPTRREDEWMGEASDDVKQRMAAEGRRAAERARSAVEGAQGSNGGPARSSRREEAHASVNDPRTEVGGTFAGPNPPGPEAPAEGDR